MGEVLDRGPAPDDFVQSVSRALRVLEVVTARPGLPVKAIARHCGLNLSTTYHLIRTLAYEGYVRRLPDGCYDVGAELPRRFHDVIDSLGRPPQSHSVLGHLAQVSGLSAYLGRLSGTGIVVAQVVEGRARRTSRTSRSVSRSPPTRPRSARRSSPRCRPPSAAATSRSRGCRRSPPTP